MVENYTLDTDKQMDITIVQSPAFVVLWLNKQRHKQTSTQTQATENNTMKATKYILVTTMWRNV